jgi:hypothetical protein
LAAKSDTPEQHRRERDDVDAESEIEGTGIQGQRDNENQQHEHRGGLARTSGSLEEKLDDTHLQPEHQPPYDRPSHSKIQPHLSEKTRRNILCGSISEGRSTDPDYAFWKVDIETKRLLRESLQHGQDMVCPEAQADIEKLERTE